MGTSVRKLASEVWEKSHLLHGKVEKGKQTPVHGERSTKYRAIVADSKRSMLAEEVACVLQRAADDVRAAGHEVSPKMIAFVQHEARIKKYRDGTNMLEQVRKMLLREATNAYVCTLSTYRRQGLNLNLSLSSLDGEILEIKVNREVSIAGVAGMVQAVVRPVVQGKAREVKLVRPNGTLLPCARAIGDVLDHESDEEPPDDEDSVFYPLATLIGETWKEMGLHGPTRWKHLREDEFKDLFGMSKKSFEKLQSWTQLSLKKKHGLF